MHGAVDRWLERLVRRNRVTTNLYVATDLGVPAIKQLGSDTKEASSRLQNPNAEVDGRQKKHKW